MNTGVIGQGALPQIIYVQQPAKHSKKYDNYNKGVAKGLGITRIVSGSLCIIIQLAIIGLMVSNYRVRTRWYSVSTGFWGGIPVSVDSFIIKINEFKYSQN